MPKKISKKIASVKKSSKKVVVKKKAKSKVSKPFKNLVVKKNKSAVVKSVKVLEKKPVLTLDEIFAQIDFQADDLKPEVVMNNEKTLDELFDDIFSSVEQPRKRITLEDLFAPITQSENDKDDELESLLDELLNAPVSLNTPVGPTSHIVHSVNESPDFQAYEEALRVYNSGKNFFRSVFMGVSVVVAALVIGVMWLQVTYGYFTELDNTDSQIESTIDNSLQEFNIIKTQAQETLKTSIDKYQELKSLNK